MDNDLSPIARARKDQQRLDKFWRGRHRSMTRCEAFLAGERYEVDNGTQNRDRRLTQIRGQETQDTIRHVVGELSKGGQSIEPRGIDSDSDQEQAEIEAALVEYELSNNWKGYKARRYEAIQSAREKRLGIVWMDWDPDCGPYGEILYSFQDPRRVMWDPAYDPHHPNCDLLIRRRRMDVERARKLYKAPWLMPDRISAFDDTGRIRPGVPLLRGVDGEAASAMDYDDENVTIDEFWYKNDKSTKTRDVANSEPVELPQERRYMACTNPDCDYRSKTEGEVEAMGEEPPTDVNDERIVSAYIENGNTLPEEMPGACPKCGDNLERIDAKNPQEDVFSYARGKRLLIMAPCCAGPDDKPLYNGNWPAPKARSYPALFVYAYVKPGEPVGPCDVDYMWDQQISCDNLRTIGLQRVYEQRNYWVLPKAGITDRKGRRWEAREDQYNTMFRDASIGFDTKVELLNGTGVDSSWGTVFSVMQQALTQYRGVADFGLTDESSKNIPVGTVQTIERQENIPVADAKRRMNDEEGKFYGIVSDYIHAFYTPERVARLRIEGVDIIARMWGDDLPNYDYVLEEAPEFTGLEKARAEAWNGLLQTYQQALALQLDPMDAIEIYADVNKLPRNVVRKFEKMILKQRAAAEKAKLDAANAITPPADGGGEEDILAQLMAEQGGDQGQLNGDGMEPAPVGA